MNAGGDGQDDEEDEQDPGVELAEPPSRELSNKTRQGNFITEAEQLPPKTPDPYSGAHGAPTNRSGVMKYTNEGETPSTSGIQERSSSYPPIPDDTPVGSPDTSAAATPPMIGRAESEQRRTSRSSSSQQHTPAASNRSTPPSVKATLGTPQPSLTPEITRAPTSGPQNMSSSHRIPISKSASSSGFDKIKDRRVILERMVHPVAAKLADIFGFQKTQAHALGKGEPHPVKSSLDNQVAHCVHLLLNIIPRSLAEGGSSNMISLSISKLHRKMMGNYFKWVMFLGLNTSTLNQAAWISIHKSMNLEAPSSKKGQTVTHSSEVASDAEVTQQLEHVMLMLLIWGESGNIRHTPECLMLIFHSALCHLATGDPFPETFAAEDFINSIITPFYSFISEQTKYTMSLPPYGNAAAGITYDDFNECFWDIKVVSVLLGPEAMRPGPAITAATLAAGGAAPPTDPITSPYRHLKGYLAKCTNESLLEVFHKTYKEQRSWGHVYFSFKRVIMFHAVLFHILVTAAFKEWRWRYVSTSCISHALLEAIYELVSITLDATVKPKTSSPCFDAIRRIWKLPLKIMIIAGLVFCYVTDDQQASSYQMLGALYFGAYVCGFYFNQNGYLMRLQFKCSFCFIGWETNEYVASPEEMTVPWRSYFQYTMFWFVVLGIKISFNYFFMIAPLVKPSEQLWERRWLNTGHSDWHPDGDLLLILLRWSAPFLMMFADTNLWYILCASVYSSFDGWWQQLGSVSEWTKLVHVFPSMAEAMNRKLISPASVMQIVTEPVSLLDGFSEPPRTEAFYRFAHLWNQVVHKLREGDLLSDKERDELLFVILDPQGPYKDFWGPGRQHYVIYPCLLTSPVFCSTALDSGASLYHPRRQVMEQMRDLTVWFLVTIGVTKYDKRSQLSEMLTQMAVFIEAWAPQQSHYTEKLQTLKKNVISLLQTIMRIRQAILPDADQIRRDKPKARRSNMENAASSNASYNAHRDSQQVRASVRTKMERQDTWQLMVHMFLGGSPQARVDLLVKPLEAVLSSWLDLAGLGMEKPQQASIRPYTFKIVETSKYRAGHIPTELANLLNFDNLICADMMQLIQNIVSDDLDAVVYAVWVSLNCQNVGSEPRCKEAKRQLQFFAASLNHPHLTTPSPVEQMKSWSSLTPVYNEDVIYSMPALLDRTRDGVNLLGYLKTQYKDEYENFKERIGVVKDEHVEAWERYAQSSEHHELRDWATQRGQLLARTVRGVMCNNEALRTLARLEGCPEEHVEDLVNTKFHYVVAAQVYGQLKNAKPGSDDAWKGHSIDLLRGEFPSNLRVAYVDNTSTAGQFYSVCLGVDDRGVDTVQYKVRLPGNPIIGYGKPENQNHAIIFAHGEFLQVLDMNQDNYLTEAFKTRNLLDLFEEDTGLMGFREHIFSESSGAVASFAASTEFIFGTLVQRFLTDPLNVRFHYGHPDFFDKLWVMTRGGLSKACKDIHVSEDIFGGLNVTMRGNKIKYCEFIHCGKGRDMGFSQINGFETKISGGNGLQCLSRDVHRLGQKMDFFRLMSFYHSGPGQYVNTVVMVSAAHVFALSQVVLAISNSERYCEETGEWGKCVVDNTVIASSNVYAAEWMVQLGLVTTLPQLAELCVEYGIFTALGTVIRQFLAGSWFFFVFAMQTKAYYFDRSLVLGGAGYIATGRGYQIENTDFITLYTSYARSHIYFGAELFYLLVLFCCLTKMDLTTYVVVTWSIWLFSVAFIIGPWWFNPLSFTWDKSVHNVRLWWDWMRSPGWDVDAFDALPEKEQKKQAERMWAAWHRLSLKPLRNAPASVKSVYLLKSLPRLAIALGAISFLKVADDRSPVVVFGASAAIIIVSCLLYLCVKGWINTLHPWYRVRFTSLLVIFTLGAFGGAVWYQSSKDQHYVENILITVLGTVTIWQFMIQAISYFAHKPTIFGFTLDKNNSFSDYFYKINDIVTAAMVFLFLFACALLPVASIQSKVLFNRAFTEDLETQKQRKKILGTLLRDQSWVAACGFRSKKKGR